MKKQTAENYLEELVRFCEKYKYRYITLTMLKAQLQFMKKYKKPIEFVIPKK